MDKTRDDRILWVTRLVLAAVIVVLILAFDALYLNPQFTKQNFAWEIKPPLTAVFMGAGYISGGYMFLFAAFGKKWHRVTHIFLPITTFTVAMLLATLIHYDRFLHHSISFKLWLPIYIITPFLVPWLWIHNRPRDPGTPDAEDITVPTFVRWVTGLFGVSTLVFWIVTFIQPSLLISIWAWKLTPLTARVISGWGMLISVGGIMLFTDKRWSAWRHNIESIALWQVLMVIGSLIHRQDFYKGSLINGYFIGVLLALVILSLFYLRMELGSPRRIPFVKSAGTV